MKIQVQAKPNSKRNEVNRVDDTHYIVSVTALPEKGKANKAIEKLLAEYFDISVNRVIITFGHTSRNKTVVIARER